jgi:hypothetical protein
VPFESEGDPACDPQGAENSPPREQTDLPGGKRKLAGFADVLVVKNETVDHEVILSSIAGQRAAAGSPPRGLGERRLTPSSPWCTI